MKRPSWDEYFIEIAKQVASRATCPRLSVGAVVVRDRRILTTGYNGSPSGTEHCSESGCLMVEGHCQRTIHAEANAIVQGAFHGISLAGSSLYCTHYACFGCTKLIISAGVKQFVYSKAYDAPLGLSLFMEAGVTVIGIP
jgi:dCMP deaminase